MDEKNYNEIFTRNQGYIKDEQQLALKNSTAVIFGLGGIGGVICEVLARSGIGSFKLIDKDVFEKSNLNRQIYSNTQTINELKTEKTREALLKINPNLAISIYNFVDETNIDEILNGATIALLALYDTIPCILISRKTRYYNIPLVEGWALPFSNVRVYTSNTPSFEDVYNLPSKGKNIDVYTEEEKKELNLLMLSQLKNVNEIDHYYAKDMMKMLEERKIPSFAPMVWLNACFMSIEAIKVVLNLGKISYAPKMTLYNPFEFEVL